MTDIASLGLEVRSDGVAVASTRLKGLEQQSRLSEAAAKSMRLAFLGVVAALALAGAATYAFFKASAEAEKVQAQLNAALISTNSVSGQTIQSLNEHAAALQRLTTYDDEAIGSAQSLLLTFTKIGGETFPQATSAVLDLATRMGGDLQGAALQLGKALNMPVQGISALSRAGIQFSETQKENIKHFVETNRLAEAQAIILKEVELQFGGSAVAARETLGGALKGLQNAFGDLFEMSSEGTKGLRDSIEGLTNLISSPQVKNAIQTFGGWFLTGLSLIIEAFAGVINMIDTVIQRMLTLENRSISAIQAEIAELERFASMSDVPRMGPNGELPTIDPMRINLGEDQMQDTTDSLAALNAELARRQALQKLLDEEVQSGTPIATNYALTLDDATVSTSALGGATAKAAEEAEKANDSWSKLLTTTESYAEQIKGPLKDAWGGFWGEFKQGVTDGQTAMEAFAQAGVSALDRLADRALAMAADGIFDMIFGAVMGGISSGLTGSVGAGVGAAVGNIGGGSSSWLPSFAASAAKAAPNLVVNVMGARGDKDVYNMARDGAQEVLNTHKKYELPNIIRHHSSTSLPENGDM